VETQKTKVNTCSVYVNHGKLRIRLPRSVSSGKQLFLYTGLVDSPINWKRAQQIALMIEADIDTQRLDTSLERYKLERVLATPNKWCSYVNNASAYCITIAGAGNYTNAIFTNIGIESQDDQHSFFNGTGVKAIWTYPTTASGFQIYGASPGAGSPPPVPVAAENNNRGWYSTWFPLQNGNNAIGFYNQ
jgi:hypothetical protein